jgi:hypothetical protein
MYAKYSGRASKYAEGITVNATSNTISIDGKGDVVTSVSLPSVTRADDTITTPSGGGSSSATLQDVTNNGNTTTQSIVLLDSSLVLKNLGTTVWQLYYDSFYGAIMDMAGAGLTVQATGVIFTGPIIATKVSSGGSGVWDSVSRVLVPSRLTSSDGSVAVTGNDTAGTVDLSVTSALAGETLQAVTDRGNVTTQSITANRYIFSTTTGTIIRAELGDPRGTGAVDLQANAANDEKVASGNYATISGGFRSTASGTRSTVSGGQSNVASGGYTTVGGGFTSTASGTAATVAGGDSNQASGVESTVGGGFSHEATGQYSTIAGGDYGQASGYASTIPGGEELHAQTRAITVFGRYNNPGTSYSATLMDDREDLLEIGNGTDRTHRQNAFTVKGSGDTSVTRDLTARDIYSTRSIFAATSIFEADKRVTVPTRITSSNAGITATASDSAGTLAIAPVYGSIANTITQGNDSRLSDARTPVGTALTSANIWVGSSGNVAAAVSPSGDVTIGNTGVTAIGSNKVTDAMLRQSAGLSVIGRSANSTGNVADITAANTGQVLRYSGTTIGFGAVDLADTDAVTGALPAGNGGTGQSSYTTGDLLYASSSSALSKLADVATGNVLISGGTSTAPSYGQITNSHVSSSAAIAYSKLNLSTSIVNADVASGAAIVDTKLATISTAGKVSDSALSSNIPLKNGTNTFSGANDFSNGALSLTNGTSNRLQFGTNGVAAPDASSAGMKIKLYGANGGMGFANYGFGIEGGYIWAYTDYTGGMKWYASNSGNTAAVLYATNEANGFGTSGRIKAGATAAPTSGAYIQSTGGISDSSVSAGIGYATGAGGTVSQLTDKTTGVTIDKVCGTITMNNATLNAGTIVSFTVTDASMAATDVVIVNHTSGGTVGAYTLNAAASAAGSFQINVRNETAGNLSEAIVIRFAIIKGVTS